MIVCKGKPYTLEQLNEICQGCTSVRELCKELGYSMNSGGSASTVKDLISKHELDCSHFTGQSHKKNLGSRRTATEEYLSNSVKITSHKLRLRLLEDGTLEKKCCSCSNTEWLGQPIPLELHHKDGNLDNNKIENLELRCPNCHYFTDSYKSKNVRK